MASNQVAFADIFGESLELLRRHFGLLAGTGVAIVAGYTALDMLGAAGANFAVNLVVSIMVQYLVLEQLLADRISPEAKGKRRYGSMFGASFLSGLGVVLGLIALVLPAYTFPGAGSPPAPLSSPRARDRPRPSAAAGRRAGSRRGPT